MSWIASIKVTECGRVTGETRARLVASGSRDRSQEEAELGMTSAVDSPAEQVRHLEVEDLDTRSEWNEG